MIPRDFVDELIARADIVEVIDGYVPLRKAGKDYMACCPFHQEKTPSFTVSRDKQFYYCFGCGATGNVVSFLIDHAGLDFVEAVTDLAGRLGLEVPQAARENEDSLAEGRRLYEVLNRVAAFYIQQLHQHPAAAEARAYLNRRGLDEATQDEFQLGFAPPGWNALLDAFGDNPATRRDLMAAGMLSENDQGKVYDRFRQRVMFPIHDQRGRVIAFGGRVLDQGEPKYLNSPETELFHKGRELYGLHRLRKARPRPERVVVVEGYMDVVGLARHGIDNAVATLGTATSGEHIARLFRAVEHIVFCFDGDRAGRQAAWRALEAALPHLEDGREIRFAFLPEGEDPDSLAREQGGEGFLARLDQSMALSEMLFGTLVERTDLRFPEGKAKLVKEVNPLLGRIPGEVLRNLLVQRLSKITELKAEQIQFGIEHQAPPPPPMARTPAKKRIAPSPMRTAVGLLLQYPGWIAGEERFRKLPRFRLPGGDLLAELADFVQSRAHLAVTTGMLLEHWKASPQLATLHKLATWEQPLHDETQVRQEFWDAITRLEEQQRDHQLDTLLQKANVTELNEEERGLLAQLYRQRAEALRTVH